MTPNVFSLPLLTFISLLVSPLLLQLHLFSLSVVHISMAILILFLPVHSATALLESLQEVGYENNRGFFYSNILQGLRTGLDMIFFDFSWKKMLTTLILKHCLIKVAVSQSLKQNWVKYLIFFVLLKCSIFIYMTRGLGATPLLWPDIRFFIFFWVISVLAEVLRNSKPWSSVMWTQDFNVTSTYSNNHMYKRFLTTVVQSTSTDIPKSTTYVHFLTLGAHVGFSATTTF